MAVGHWMLDVGRWMSPYCHRDLANIRHSVASQPRGTCPLSGDTRLMSLEIRTPPNFHLGRSLPYLPIPGDRAAHGRQPKRQRIIPIRRLPFVQFPLQRAETPPTTGNCAIQGQFHGEAENNTCSAVACRTHGRLTEEPVFNVTQGCQPALPAHPHS